MNRATFRVACSFLSVHSFQRLLKYYKRACLPCKFAPSSRVDKILYRLIEQASQKSRWSVFHGYFISYWPFAAGFKSHVPTTRFPPGPRSTNMYIEDIHAKLGICEWGLSFHAWPSGGGEVEFFEWVWTGKCSSNFWLSYSSSSASVNSREADGHILLVRCQCLLCYFRGLLVSSRYPKTCMIPYTRSGAWKAFR